MGVLVTGVPGFIGKRLVEALLPDGRPVYLLCERRFEAQTRDLVRALAEDPRFPQARTGCHVVPGDITEPDIGLSPAHLARVKKDVDEVYHLAAIYDLAVPAATARRVNVDGTRHVVDLIRSIPGCRHNYISTCYVAGDRRGMVFEDELERGQRFKNHYESTKYEAERIVRASQDQVETRIFRPAIVIGDSRTGETDKFDGPYFAFRALLMGLLLVQPGECQAASNLVPVDYIVDALREIPRQANTAGKTFALCDPHSPTAQQLIELAADRLGISRPKARVPAWLFRVLLERRVLSRFFGIPPESLAYFNLPVVFDDQNTRQALEGTDVRCPPLPAYLNVILRYYLQRVDVPWSLAPRAHPRST